MQQQIIRETFHLVSKRDDNVCNFLEGGRQVLLLAIAIMMMMMIQVHLKRLPDVSFVVGDALL